MEGHKKILVKDLNSVITCRLCEGYLVDATTLVECLHTFCRACILRHFENSKTLCPTCNMVYKKKSQSCFRSDTQIQALVYKLVPSLYVKEMQRREDFYRSTGVRAGSSCSDDSVLERERDIMNDSEEMISSYVGDKMQFYSPDDSISLSLEYYQTHLDIPDVKDSTSLVNNSIDNDTQTDNSEEIKSSDPKSNVSDSVNSVSTQRNNGQVSEHLNSDKEKTNTECDKRFLQCPAAVTMKHLQKFIRMKYGLTGDHKVDIVYKGEVLPSTFSLMDVAYTFKWEKIKPMRFFYRIFTPMKVRPIKIINTTLSTGGKQLQIVPVNPDLPKVDKPEKKEEVPNEKEIRKDDEETEDQKQDKERLFAHLQLQSKSKVQNPVETKKTVPETKIIKDCIFEYEEPDQEEIKRFAERRDREWALQKKLEEDTRQEEEYTSHHFTKKRKKSKHSKNEFNPHKKRKLHAEITSNEKEDLKLKVKITTNGHKHKHHKICEIGEKSQLSSKEKLLQMRQVRHKHLSGSGDEKSTPSIKISKEEKNKVSLEKQLREKSDDRIFSKKESAEERSKRESPKPAEIQVTFSEEKKKLDDFTASNQKTDPTPSYSKSISTISTAEAGSSVVATLTKTVRPEVKSAKWGMKIPTVQIERNEQTEKQAQKTFLKTFQSYAERYQKIEKINQNKMENAKLMNKSQITSITTNNKNLDRKIANLQQRCTIEPKTPTTTMIKQEKVDKKVVSFNNEKAKVLTPQYPPGFTVSKIETGVKRKTDEPERVQDKRPSLEITLINPHSTSPAKPTDSKPVAKRPPPATIPLERIKKSVNLKSGISIIPKLPERCDNIGALDLSKPNKSPEIAPKVEILNGLNKQLNNTLSRTVTSPPVTTSLEKSNVQLSNLQMLSKVATEHSTLNKISPNNATKPRPQMPSLQTLKVPSLQNPGGVKTPNIQRMPPKLNEIQKFRPSNPQIRNLRPNQNQNIRNIPNPSLLVNRQQNQNRLVTPSLVQPHGDKNEISPKPQTSPSSTGGQTQKDTSSLKSNTSVLEQKVTEKQEITV